MKADKIDIEKIFEIKSDKATVDSLQEFQTTMHSQFKHILILFIELVDLHTDRPNDTGNSKK